MTKTIENVVDVRFYELMVDSETMGD